MADLDIDNLLKDLDNCVDTSPQHKRKQLHVQTQENLSPQYANGTMHHQRNISHNQEEDNLDGSMLDKLLSMIPTDNDDFKTANSPVCPLKRRPLKESKIQPNVIIPTQSVLGNETIDDILLSASAVISEDITSNIKHSSPRPPPPRKRTGHTPQQIQADDAEEVESFPNVILMEKDSLASPPSNPDTSLGISPALHPRKEDLMVTRSEEQSGAVLTGLRPQSLDVSDFDDFDDVSPESAASLAAYKHTSADRASVLTKAPSEVRAEGGPVDHLDPVSISQEIDELFKTEVQTESYALCTSSQAGSSISTATSEQSVFAALPIAVNASGSQKKHKCIKASLAGPTPNRGQKTSSFSHNIVCGNLRCLKCNFTVRTYPKAAWAPTVDYMFLRNGFPDDQKLSAKLVHSSDSCAYCCQCSWAVAAEEQETKELGLSWNCSGHPDAA